VLYSTLLNSTISAHSLLPNHILALTHCHCLPFTRQMALIRDALDDNTAFPKCTPHSIVEVLSSFLAALSKPLLSPELYPAVSSTTSTSISARLLSTLSFRLHCNAQCHRIHLFILIMERNMLHLGRSCQSSGCAIFKY
jgi:hypothetical protein